MATRWDPSKNKTYQILKSAEDGGFGVVAPIAYNLEHVVAFVRAAEAKRSPLIIQVFPWALGFSSDLLVHTAAHAAKRASVPVAIHLDHAQDEHVIRYAAINLPFDSIMIDMSHYDMDENLERTRDLVRFCHERGVAAEAEPGRIEGGEDGIASCNAEELQGSLTTEGQLEDFIATGVDFVAPCVGNVHGEYIDGPILDFDRLRETAAGRVRMVLHGTNDFPDTLMRECISGGFSKINVNKLVLDKYLDHLKRNAVSRPLTALMEEGVVQAQQSIEWQMDVCGSSGRADL